MLQYVTAAQRRAKEATGRDVTNMAANRPALIEL